MLNKLEEDIKLSDVIDVDFLQKFQDTFAEATGMASIIVDSKGPITRPSNFTDFCIKHTRGTKEGYKRCNDCDLKGGKISAATGEPYLYSCHAGLRDFAAPIIVDGKLVGSVLGGQVLTKTPDIEKFVKTAKELGINEDKYLKALENIKIVPEAQIEAAARILFIVANSISEIGYRNLKLSKNSEKINAILSGMIDGVITIDENNTIMYCNSAITDVYKFTSKELIGKHISILIPELNDDYSGELAIQDLKNSKTNNIFLNTKNGIKVPVEIKCSEIVIDSESTTLLVLRDISERNEITKIKNDFVSMVSHELKTPLASLRGALGIVNSSVSSEMSEKAKNLLAIANNNSMRLVNLINDILDIENIEAGKMSFHMEPLEISPIIEQAIISNAQFAEKLGIKIKFENQLCNEMVKADKSRLSQVVNNLVSNAVKFSNKHSNIKVSACKIDDEIRIAVKNSGESIPEKFSNQIFEKFSQLTNSDGIQKGGSGLGLSISKAIIENMGGTINFKSQDGETEFYFLLPQC